MPIIDVHAHFGPSPFPVAPHGVAEIEGLMKRFGIEVCCLASSLALTGDLVGGNQALAEAIDNHAGLRGMVVINPNFVDVCLEEMRKYLYQPNFVAAKLHGARHAQALTSEETRALIVGLLRYDRPLFLHLRGMSDIDPLQTLAKEYPTCPIVIAEMGREAWRQVVRVAEACTNVHLECGGVWAEQDKIKYAAEAVGGHRIVFGSNLPLVHPVYALGMVRDAGISPRDKDRILHQNARKLFRIE
jgi:predicted TIM-barrel fold metal-dependent hydrolase